MRNYLLFEDFINKNNSKNINTIYLNCKKTYIKHKNKLNSLNQNIKKEQDFFKNTLSSINKDFKIYKNDLDNTDLTHQYKTIVNNTDDYYLNKINNINYTIYEHKIETDIFIKILTDIFSNLENYNTKIYNLNKVLNDIDKNNFNTYIYKIILKKKLYDSNLNNKLNSILDKNSYTLDILLTKINSLNNIISKNKHVLDKLKGYKNNISNSTNNNNIHLLNTMYTNTLNNHDLFKKKLHMYYTTLDTITDNIEKNRHITNNKSSILLKINKLIKTESKTNIIKLLKKMIFKNTHKNYITKFKHLINKVKLIKSN